MSSVSNTSKDIKDPCAEFGPVQKKAALWFFCVVVGGSFVVSQLARLDSYMYENNAETLDYGKYKENRVSQYSVPSEGMDPRANGALPSSSITQN